jgi:hypothetical protein
MMVTGLVKDGTIGSLDDFAHNYVPWWDKTGEKGQVTVRQLLSFTSGFGEGTPGNENSTSTCMDNATNYPGVTYDSCAQMLFKNTTLHGTPGKTFSYNSVHLQLAGAVATHAANMTIQEVISKYVLVEYFECIMTGLSTYFTAIITNRYLLDPYEMNNTYCNEPSLEIPELAICLNTTGRDYASFLHKTLTKSVLGADLVAESEKDYTSFLPKAPLFIYGDYAFGHFRECFDSYNGYNDACDKANVHSDPGAFGFYPLIDRHHEYYMEIVAFEGNSELTYARSGIPEYLRQLVKPLVDAVIVGGDDPVANVENHLKFGHHTPALNGLGLADINYIVGCYADPESCL